MKKLSLLGLLLAASVAFAVPTQLGFSGGFTVPNAEIQQGVSLTMTYDDSLNYDEFYGKGWTKLPLTQLSFGLGQSFEVTLGIQQMAEEFNIGLTSITRESGDTDYQTWNASVKYALPYTLWKGKLAIGLDYQSTDISVNNPNMLRSRQPSGSSEWFGLLVGTFPVFTDTTFSTALIYNDQDAETAYGFGLEKGLAGKAAVGVEYIVNSPLYYHMGNDDYGTVYAKIPFGDMFTGRLALTGINDEAKLAASITAGF